MDNGYFRAPLASDAYHLASRLREGDAKEVEAMHGQVHVEKLLLVAIEMSTLCWAHCAPGGEPTALLGVAPVLKCAGVGVPWMLCSDLADQFPKVMMRDSKIKVREMHTDYPHLINNVDVRNVKAVRWLRRLGFTLLPPEPMGRNGELFHRFTMG